MSCFLSFVRETAKSLQYSRRALEGCFAAMPFGNTLLRHVVVGAALLSSCHAHWGPGPNQEQYKWPYTPFTSSDLNILDSRGQPVKYAGTNWPGCLHPMVPEGLQYASADSIAEKIASIGMNVIRLGWATEMIDDIYEKGHDTDLRTTFVQSLGETEGEKVFQEVLRHNPEFNPATTRLEAFDAVAAACFRHNIWVHLDNHQSEAGWCCNSTDGNGWFGYGYFNVAKWIRGLEFMARYASAWPNLVSMSLANELRNTTNPVSYTYGWKGWYENMIPAAQAVHDANPNVLIFLSGLNYDLDISPLVSGQDLGGGYVFDKTKYDFEDKIVLELHDYSWDQSDNNCTTFAADLYNMGWYVMNPAITAGVKNRLPVVMTEFGFAPNTYQSSYSQCLKEFLIDNGIGWTMWDVCGSYYIRQGIENFDETWGLLNENWTAWRSESAMQDFYIPLVRDTEAGH